MEDNSSAFISDGSVCSIKFGMSTIEELCTYSISDCPISHPSQLANPFLGLPLESGKCESCGTTEHGKCEGHFGYIQLPIPVYHPSHVSELKHILNLVCLKCLRVKRGKVKQSHGRDVPSMIPCSYCRDLPPISIKEVKTTDGAMCLELRVPSRTRIRDGFWNFLDRYGFHYGDTLCRALLPYEALNVLKLMPEETKNWLTGKGYFPQSGFIMQCIPVPPNCLCVPEISDGKSIMSSDISMSMLRKVLNKIELIKKSRSGQPNFESHEVESSDLQSSIANYMLLRGTTKTPQDINRNYAVGSDAIECSAAKWLEKMKQLFISKGSGFSSRSVITGDAYIGINEIGLPSEISKRITFEERVTVHNEKHLQKMVDAGLCVTYRDGFSTYAIAVGSKGHTSLRIGQVINRQIMDGDMVFVNRPPSTHKHSLQAFSVYIHDDHTVKINPLICAPLGADFDGDCIHIFYPQSLAAKAEVVELFSVEKQLLSSHDGKLHLKLVHDSLLALKLISNIPLVRQTTAQQLAMHVTLSLPPPALVKVQKFGSFWSMFQILQAAMPACVDCYGERYLIKQSEILKLDFNRDILQSSFMEIISSIFTMKGPKEALKFFNTLQPLLMEMLYLEGYSISLKDFDVEKTVIEDVCKNVQEISSVLHESRLLSNEFAEVQVENHLKICKMPITTFILKHSAMGNLIDSKSNSAILKVVQQLGFLGLQLYNKGKLYSKTLVDDVFMHFATKYFTNVDLPSEAYGLVKNSFFDGLNSYEVLIHSISSREVIVRSSRGLTEPGTLFKNLMAILRDVIICYDKTVRNVCSSAIVQFEYCLSNGGNSLCVPVPGDPVGVLAATAISNPAYKAVLDSSQSTNSSWELMKEILLCKVNHKNDVIDRQVILYLNDCFCGRKFCKENAALTVLNSLKRITLKDCTNYFSIEYQKHITLRESSKTVSGLVGHMQLDKVRLEEWNRSTNDILQKCQDVISSYGKKKGHLSHFFRKIFLSTCECHKESDQQFSSPTPCIKFSYFDANEPLERIIDVIANAICPILLDTIIKGDPRVRQANIVWIRPESTSWVRNTNKILKGELAVEVLIEKDAARRNGDAWRTALDACLPVMHHIDTSRSIPYGIQQIQEFLGISCTFDQSVQRLSASIKMVEKGVIKEHLVLVGNSMTCTGNLIGFNRSGFKALFRSSKVQVPFTEATLYTPMKCFERAADKCHSDSIASVVSSCSWGKHVTIGTGTPFQILWGKKQMDTDKDTAKDVYEFLELVRTTDKKDEDTTCMGFDVDDFIDEDGNDEMCYSPEPNAASEKPTFDENPEPKWNFQTSTSKENVEDSNATWEKVSPSAHGWENKKQPCSNNADLETSKTGVWSSWAAVKVQHQPVESTVAANEFNQFNSWDNGVVQNHPRISDHSEFKENWKTSSSGSERNEDKVDLSERSTVWDKNVTSKPEAEPWKSASLKFGSWGSQSSGAEKNKWKLGEAQDGRSQEEQVPQKHDWDTIDQRRTGDSPFKAGSPKPKENVWGNKSLKKDSGLSSDVDKWRNSESGDVWGFKKQSPEIHDWKTTSRRDTDGIGIQQKGTPNENVWDAQTSERTNIQKSSDLSGWGEKRANDNGGQAWRKHGWGSSNNADRRIRSNNSTRPGRPDERVRLDSFSADEEMILVDVQPTIDSIKRILRDSSDGERLSAEDQNFIVDNVFQYHPDKEAKVTGQIDYIMVDKHQTFQDTRCFFAVSCDGSRSDFSYIKCMENFVRHNFPQNADSFNRKYFRKRRSEPSIENAHK